MGSTEPLGLLTLEKERLLERHEASAGQEKMRRRVMMMVGRRLRCIRGGEISSTTTTNEGV